MLLENSEFIKLIIGIGTITYSVVFGIVAKKVWDVPKTVQSKLDEFERTLAGRINEIEVSQELTTRRVDVHDRISSKIIKKDFDSKAIVETGVYPDAKGSHV